MKDKLKLFVWENVLCDYKHGIAFAYAKNSIHARELIGKKMGRDSDDLLIEPKEIIEPEGFYIYGGG